LSCFRVLGALKDLQRELRHKSEDIHDLVLLDVVESAPAEASQDQPCLPYIAGYGEDGKTAFIDRHLSRSFRWLLKAVRSNRLRIRALRAGGYQERA
jgi:hypothetical protein